MKLCSGFCLWMKYKDEVAEINMTNPVLPSYRILPFCNGLWPQNTTPENSAPFNGMRYLHSMSDLIFGLSFPVLCWTLSTTVISLYCVMWPVSYLSRESCDRGVCKYSSLSLSHTHTHTHTHTHRHTHIYTHTHMHTHTFRVLPKAR